MTAINNSNEYLADHGGSETFNKISKNDKKNLDIIGDDTDNNLGLDGLWRTSRDVKQNIDIFYDGGDGIDSLDYTNGNGDGLTVSVSEHSGYDFKIEGGQGDRVGDAYRELSSLDVHTHDVEVFDLSGDNDYVDIKLSDVTFDVLFYLGAGNDTYYGTNDESSGNTVFGQDGDDYIQTYDGNDAIYGGSGNDTIFAGKGDDFVDTGDVNTGTQEEVTLGEGRDTLYLGDLGLAHGDYSEISTVFTGWSDSVKSESNLLEEALLTGLDLAIASISYSYPVSAYVVISAFEAASDGFKSLFGGASDSGMISEPDNNDESSFVKVHDFNPIEDIVVMPILNFDYVSADVDYWNGEVYGTFSLDAESGGKFLQLQYDSEEFDDWVESYQDISDVSKLTIYDDVQTVMWGSQVVFFKEYDQELEEEYVVAKQGSTIIFDSSDADAATQTEFSTMLDTLSGQLDVGEYVAVIGNFVGLAGTFDGDTHFAAGTEQNDTMRVSSDLSNDSAEYYFYGAEGSDFLVITDDLEEKVTFDGGDDVDFISFDEANLSASEGVVFVLDDEHNHYTPSVSDGHYVLSNVEGIIGSSYDDRLIGDDADNVIFGGAGGDHIEGLGGNDVIDLGTGWNRVLADDRDDSQNVGDDYIFTGVGYDLIDGGGGTDTADFSKDTMDLVIDLSDTWDGSNHWFTGWTVDKNFVSVTTSGGKTHMISIENIVGSQGDDTIIGDDNDNILQGGEGQDQLTGGGGADVFVFQGAEDDDDKTWSEEVTDFSLADDKLKFTGTYYDSFEQITTWYVGSSDSTVVYYGDGSVELLGGDFTGSLTQEHFDFA